MPAYTIAKYGMSLTTLGLAQELRSDGVSVNSLWPRTTIASAAVRNVLGGDEMIANSRTPDIMADAAYVVLTGTTTGNFYIDDDVLAAHGVTDFDRYRVVPGDGELELDLSSTAGERSTGGGRVPLLWCLPRADSGRDSECSPHSVR